MSSPTIISLGCRLNAHEAEVMARHAGGAGLAAAAADTVIVNTCAVTAEAVRQAAQTVRRLRRERPQARIVVTGCAAQIEPQRFAGMAQVDHVFGNGEKMLPATFEALAAGTLPRVKVDDIMATREAAPHMMDGFGTLARSYVEVQNGCDHRCTFCVIPYGRGPSRSVPAGEVVRRIERLVAGGTREIVLTGVDITSYGADLPGGATLGKLVGQILRNVPGLLRLRLSSIDQVEADPHLVSAIAEEERLMPHLHLSIQSGSDMVLKRMKRRHLRADAVAFCRQVRRLRPDIALGADLIAGFPTETEEQFAQTLDIVDRCELSFLHVFPYSPRPGTPAARMPQVERTTVKERASRLRARGQARLRDWLDGHVGRVLEVAVENTGTNGTLICRTPQYARVDASAALPHPLPGDTLRVRVDRRDGERLIAEACR